MVYGETGLTFIVCQEDGYLVGQCTQRAYSFIPGEVRSVDSRDWESTFSKMHTFQLAEEPA